MTARSQAELVVIRKLAQELAQARKERLTSVHLVAAIAGEGGPAAALLQERRLDRDALLKATRTFDEDAPDVLGRAMSTARDVSKRGPAPEPGALHLLIALLADRRSAAHRALAHSGVDLARLRTSAMQLALGVVAARRAPAPPARKPPEARRAGSSAQAGVAVPLFPPPPRAPASKAPPSPTLAVPVTPPARRPRPSSPPERPGAPEAPFSEPRQAEALSRGPERPSRAPAEGRRASPASKAPEAFALDPALFPVLTASGRNLCELAAKGELDPIVGREAEIERALDVLAKREGNNPLLVGPPGVGKTSVARGVAHRIVSGGGSEILVEISAPSLVAQAGGRVGLAPRVAALSAECARAGGRVVLFLDEIHELFAGGFEEAVAELKVGLARGELRIVGATTTDEYRQSVEAEPGLARRFSAVEIEESDEEDAFLLLRRVAEGLGRHHGLGYADDALASAVSWSIRYLPGRALPDKAIALLDLAGARTRRRSAPSGRAESGPGKAGLRVGPEDVAEVVSEMADLPIERLLETDGDRMLALERILGERVVGHAEPLSRIARVLRKGAAGLRGRRPIGTFLLLGPTGVGKTETAKAIAEALFHSPDAMTRLDLSEYAEPHAVARLVGAPPGYVGHEAGGQLTEAVRRRPYQVILLDEIEKAHRDVLEAFLQVFDEGRMTDGRGRRVDFTNTVIVLTSNLGAAESSAPRGASMGFSARQAPSQAPDRSAAVIAAARQALPPELYNRLDEVLAFAPLTREDVGRIAHKLLSELGEALAERGVSLDVGEGAVEILLSAGGFDPELGARPMRRTVARLVEAPLAEMLLRGEIAEGSMLRLLAEGGRIAFDVAEGRHPGAHPICFV